MPTYLFLCNDCNNEFEDFLSTTAPLPQDCPNCKVQGKITRLICGNVRGVVELTGQDLKDHCKSEGIKLRDKAARNPNVMANLVGEAKYETIVKSREKTATLFRRK